MLLLKLCKIELELTSHDDAAANAEQEIVFYRSITYLIKRGSLRGMYDTKMVCCAQFQIRQILHICFLLLWVVFDSDFLLLFFFWMRVWFLQSLWLILKASQGTISAVWKVIAMCLFWYPRNHSCHFSTSYKRPLSRLLLIQAMWQALLCLSDSVTGL